MIVYEAPRVTDCIPVIDLGASRGGDTDRDDVAREIARAARDIGFFYIVDHGVPASLIKGEFAIAHQFFDQPLDAKMAIDVKRSPIMRGYEPMGLQTLDVGSPPDLKESLMLGRDLGPDHPWVRAGTPYEGPNQWPANLPGFQAQATAYLDAMMTLGRQLARLVALSLELPGDYFAEALVEPSCTTRLLRYPPQCAVADNQIGCGAHTDWGFLTILLQDDIGGLEVQNVAGDWIVAPPIPGAFVINLGDMMPFLTNGRYRSTPHRVLNNRSGRDRHSVATFFNPGSHARVSCVPTCRIEGQAESPDISFGEHIQSMFAKTYGRAA